MAARQHDWPSPTATAGTAIPDGVHPVATKVTSVSPASAVGSLAPVAAFLVFDAWLGLVPAMVAASVASVVAIVLRRQRGGSIGLLLPTSLVYTAAKAIAGVLTESQVVYFGTGLVLSALLALAVGATAFTRRPAASFLLPLVTPYRHMTPHHPIHRRVSAQVTVVWAMAELAATAWEARHLTNTSASEFVVTRTVVAWPAMALVIFLIIAYARFRLDPHEHFLDRAASR